MNNFAVVLYTIFLPVFLGITRLFSPLHPKLKTFFRVRKGVFEELKQKIDTPPFSSFRVWVHAASVGEFEQARPIIAALKASHPEITFFVSFLSDSGYNARKNFPDAAAVFYLPTDTRGNARKLISLLKPDMLLLMRYDFWPNHLVEAKKRGTKLILAAAVLQKNASYFNPLLKGFYQSLFHLFDNIYTVSSKDTVAFRQIFRCERAETAGDPRFDQVLLRSSDTSKVDHLKPFYKNRTVLVAGSVWDRDEMLLLPAWSELEERPSLVLVPHQVNPENMARLYQELHNRSLAYLPVSALNDNFNPEQEILVIDQTGYLLELYSIASFAYVGGGFGVNVHNTLEPAVYNIPVLFGPRYHNSPEAEGLVAAGGATVIHDQRELATELKRLTGNTAQRVERGRAASAFVQERTGATAIIAESIERYSARRLTDG
ncbi:MAG: 3-deoxy-D-manno-octulosonic acid transferase [Chlorobium sp.]|nr:3-deoxy-D-manno-octulosonic acid transferase [Chlorobium sp.]